MEIDWIKGLKGNSDRLYLVTTEAREPITAFRLALLANQLAFNEVEIKKEWLDISKESLYFEDLVREAIKDAKKGVDWGEPENEGHIVELCQKFFLPSEKIDFDLLRRTQQRKLEEYAKGAAK